MNILITGRPGSGKTTLIERVARKLGQRAGGFLTREIRRHDRREGFQIVTLDGRHGILAHENFSSPIRVGRYGVDVEALERIGVAAVREALDGGRIVVVDEIGKMELTSAAFRNIVLEALDSPLPLLATIHVHAHPFTDALKRRPDVEILELTPSNRDAIVHRVSALLGLPV